MLRTECTMKSWLRIVYGFFGILLFGFAGTMSSVAKADSRSAVSLFTLAAGMALAGIYVLALAVQARVVVDGTRLYVRGAFQEKSAELSEIEGFRTLKTRNGSYRKLYLKQGLGSFSLSNTFATDDAFQSWFEQIPDLDQRDRQAMLEQITHDETLGATEENRLAALARAKRLGIAMATVSVASGLAVYFAHGIWQQVAVVVSALMPFVAAGMIWQKPLLYTMLCGRSDPRTNLSPVLVVAPFALYLSAATRHLIAVQALFPLIAVATVAVLLVFMRDVGQASVRLGGGIALLLMACGYGYGLVVTLDTVFDRTAPTSYTTAVIGKHLSRGRSTTYYLRLAPWGPLQYARDVSVPGKLYRSYAVDDSICVELHPGALGAAWFATNDCGSAVQSQ